MEMATLSAQGRLTIPAPYRNALHLQPGDKVTFSLDGEKLVIAPTKAGKARLVKGNGRKVLVASADAPVMSASRVNELLADFP